VALWLSAEAEEKESASENLRYLWTIGKRRQKDSAWYDGDNNCKDESLSEADESRGAVALTVAWMLSCTSTAAAMLLVLALRLIMVILPVAGGVRRSLDNIAGTLLVAGAASGLLCLVLTPLAHRVRRTRPPAAITAVAIFIGLSPILTAIALFAMRLANA
jgi:hypothetical protein